MMNPLLSPSGDFWATYQPKMPYGIYSGKWVNIVARGLLLILLYINNKVGQSFKLVKIHCVTALETYTHYHLSSYKHVEIRVGQYIDIIVIPYSGFLWGKIFANFTKRVQFVKFYPRNVYFQLVL